MRIRWIFVCQRKLRLYALRWMYIWYIREFCFALWSWHFQVQIFIAIGARLFTICPIFSFVEKKLWSNKKCSRQRRMFFFVATRNFRSAIFQKGSYHENFVWTNLAKLYLVKKLTKKKNKKLLHQRFVSSHRHQKSTSQDYQYPAPFAIFQKSNNLRPFLYRRLFYTERWKKEKDTLNSFSVHLHLKTRFLLVSRTVSRGRE